MSFRDTKSGLNCVDQGFLLQKAWHHYLGMLNSLTLEEEPLFKWTFWKEPGIVLNVHIGRGTDRQTGCSARTSLPNSVKLEKCSVDVEPANLSTEGMLWSTPGPLCLMVPSFVLAVPFLPSGGFPVLFRYLKLCGKAEAA